MKFQDAAEIVKSFVDDANNFQQLQQFLKNARLFQFAYANLFPKYFSRSDDYSIHSKLEFENVFKTWVSQKNLSTIGWQYLILNMKTDENLSEIDNPPTLLKDEKIDFEKIEVVEVVEDGTAKEKNKRKRISNPPSGKKIKKRSEKKTNLKRISKERMNYFLRLIIKIINKL